MSDKMNYDAFINDYCRGIKDRDLLSNYNITAKQLIGLVKSLINQGRISKKDYFDRARKIEELEAEQEQQFISSLYHCPVCGHIHPTPFVRCPACEADMGEYKDMNTQGHGSGGPSDNEVPAPVSAESGPDGHPERVSGLSGVSEAVSAPEVAPRPVAAAPAEPSVQEPEIPESVLRLIGAPLEELSLVPTADEGLLEQEFQIAEVICNSDSAAVFMAQAESEAEPNLIAKLYSLEPEQEAESGKYLDYLLRLQSSMDDPNVLKLLGSATCDSRLMLLYEYQPRRLSDLLATAPEGLPLDDLVPMLRQILNGLGYSHTHRGADGVVRRLPHLLISPESIYLNETGDAVKIDGCGVWRALVQLRGHTRYLYEEPWIQLRTLAPEAFVLESRSLHATVSDIYAVGVLLYQMATGQLPFHGPTLEEYRFQHIKKFPIPPKVHRYDLPPWLDEMILRCLEKEPEDRWRSATQMELRIGKQKGE
jgi:protein kinase-like protein